MALGREQDLVGSGLCLQAGQFCRHTVGAAVQGTVSPGFEDLPLLGRVAMYDSTDSGVGIRPGYEKDI